MHYNSSHLRLALIEEFKRKETFSREQLFNFFQKNEPELKEGTFGWRIYDLKKRHIIKSVKKGVYTLEEKKNFRPESDLMINRIGKLMNNSFNHHSYNIWTTAWLNNLIELQATSFIYILEVDKESMQGIFFSLKDEGKLNNLFLKPDEKMIETYISELTEAIIIKPMVSRAPVVKVKNIIYPTLEKILVDLFCDENLFFAYQGYQLVRIYEACLERYLINFSRLFNYARRRKREEALKIFFSEYSSLYEKVKEVIE